MTEKETREDIQDFVLTVVWENGRTWSKDICGEHILEKANQLLRNLENDTADFAIGCNKASFIGLFDWNGKMMAYDLYRKGTRIFKLYSLNN